MKIGRNMCKHMAKYLGDAIYVIPFPEQPWNGWLVWSNGFMKSETGLYYRVLNHLISCTEINPEFKKEIEKELKEVEKEFKKLTSK